MATIRFSSLALLVAQLGTGSQCFVLRLPSFQQHQKHNNGAVLLFSEQAPSTGLYRPFINHAWNKLESLSSLSPVTVQEELATNSALTKGNMPEGTMVKVTTAALQGTKHQSPIKYARYALLETLVPGLAETTSGIQVMNVVILPHGNAVPVWGVDLVSLPGDKHLLAMDVQPMGPLILPHAEEWKAWHTKHVDGTFEWGGDLPEEVAQYFSPFGLWTRLTGSPSIYQIQTLVMEAFQDHLNLYLDMIHDDNETGRDADINGENNQEKYLNYRRANDPARPMLKSLYGPEWTEQVLNELLFPTKF